jgi:hypothetical protein
LKNDKDVVVASVKIHGENLEYASERLKNDKEVVIEAVKNNGKAFIHAS